ncbi:MAG: permease, partial [Planctomycetota bacterium]
MSAILLQILQILNGSAVYLLAGFLLAGLLHVLLQRRRGLLDPLRGSGVRPILIASLIGTPLPLCSCSVLPAGLTLMRRGASKGTTASFLLTVPETDVVSVLLTFSLMGPVLAVARPIAGLVTGICTGLAISLVERRWETRGGAAKPAGSGAVIPKGIGKGDAVNRGAPGGEDPAHEAFADGSVGSRRGWIREALRYGYVEFFDDLIGRLLVGIVLGAGIAVV